MDEIKERDSTYSSPQKVKQIEKKLNFGTQIYSPNEETISFRKKLEPLPKQENQEDTRAHPFHSIQKVPISIQQKFVWKKKGQTKNDRLTKIIDIQPSEKYINIEGQIIFIWTKNQVYFKNNQFDKNYNAVEIYDGTGTIILYAPIKFQYQRQMLQNGQDIKLIKAQIKHIPKEKPCLIISKDTILERSSNRSIFEPEKFAITVKQLLEEPVGTIRNVMCLVIQPQQQFQKIKKNNGQELRLSKIIIFDPEQNCQAEIKLWENKTDIKFNNSIYLLRGIQTKQYKGNRQYSATKNFTYRALSYSKIQNYLRPLYERRHKLLEFKPDKIPHQSMSKALSILNQDQKLETVWSIIECNIRDIIIDSYQTYKFSLCPILDNKVMVGSNRQAKCHFCHRNPEKHENHYAIKMKFTDSNSQFSAQAYDSATIKLFAENQQTIHVEQFEQMTLQIKESLCKSLFGDLIEGLFVTIRENYGQYTKINHYLVDLMAIRV